MTSPPLSDDAKRSQPQAVATGSEPDRGRAVEDVTARGSEVADFRRVPLKGEVYPAVATRERGALALELYCELALDPAEFHALLDPDPSLIEVCEAYRTDAAVLDLASRLLNARRLERARVHHRDGLARGAALVAHHRTALEGLDCGR